MKLDKLENFEFSSAAKDAIECDLLVVYLCEESRSSYIRDTNKVKPNRIWLIRDASVDPDQKCIDESATSTSLVANVKSDISKIITLLPIEAKVVLDISCMPRVVMADILYELTMVRDFGKIEFIILYSLARFTLPVANEDANESIEPVHPGYAGWSAPETKPTSLILGLGYELHKAEGASEYFEPKDQWVFVPHSPIKEFLVQVQKNNINLLEKMDSGRLISYNVDDPELTYGQLELVVGSLLKTSNPVLLPFGPKIFFFLCLVQCVSHPELGVWLVTGSDRDSIGTIDASGIVIGVRCIFLSKPPAFQ